MSLWKTLCRFCDALRSQFSDDPLDRCRWIRLASTLSSRSDNPKDRLARAGQAEAVRFLRDKGYVVLQENVRMRDGELDIVARQGPTLVFIEVKTRHSQAKGRPHDAVHAHKQRRQIAAAQQFIKDFELGRAPCRFDIISILWPEGAGPTVEHFKRAYQPNDIH